MPNETIDASKFTADTFTVTTKHWSYCPWDGTKLEDGWAHCPKCGALIGQEMSSPWVTPSIPVPYVPYVPYYPASPLFPQSPWTQPWITWQGPGYTAMVLT